MSKTVLVTGGSRGIGKAIVTKFAEAGYNVILNYNKSESSAMEIVKGHDNIKIFKADISNRKEVHELFEFARETFKSGIDIYDLVNCLKKLRPKINLPIITRKIFLKISPIAEET